MRPSATGAGLPKTEQPPALPMSAHDRFGCDEGQMLAPADAESRTCSCAINSRCSPVRPHADRMLGFASGTSCCGSSLADQQILVWARYGLHGCEQEQEKFEH